MCPKEPYLSSSYYKDTPIYRRFSGIDLSLLVEKAEQQQKEALSLLFPQQSCQSDSHAAADKQKTSLWTRKTSEFVLIFVAYMCYLIGRKNYGFWLPSLLNELGKDKAEAGIVGSSYELAYGLCALFNGPLVDLLNPAHMLAGGLMLSGLINLSVSSTSSVPLMAMLWGLNGLAQSLGWPCVTKIFMAWFPDPARRGTWYSVLSTSQNFGAALVPWLVTAAISYMGWKAAFYVPAGVALVVGLILFILLQGGPSKKPIDKPVAGAKAAGAECQWPASTQGCKPRGSACNTAAVRSASECKPGPTMSEVLFSQVLTNPKLWLMGLTYFCISLVRSGLSDWTSVFIQEAKGMPQMVAASCVFLMEIGGFLGSIAAGAVSDKVFAGKRGPVVALCAGMVAPCVLLLRWTTCPYSVRFAYFGLGAFAFPIHMLIGLFSREVVPAEASSSAGGFVRFIAQLGSAIAGAPLGHCIQTHGWDGVYLVLCISSVLGALVSLPLWGLTPTAITAKSKKD